MNRYLRLTNPTEEEVNSLLDLGYAITAITPCTQELIRNNIYKSLETQMVYHFIFKGTKEEKK